MKKILLIVFFSCFLFNLSAAQNYKIHRAQEGETLQSIAKKYDVSLQALKKMNPDANNANLGSALLVIPFGETPDGEASSGLVRFKEYKVHKKETLYSLAREHDISVEDLKKYNTYLYKEELGENDIIRIPIFSKRNQVDYNSSVQNSTFKNLKHIVLPKETKYRISKKYGITVEKLEELNPMLGTLQPGQILTVTNPNAEKAKEKENNFIEYEVQPKETFYSLTRRFNITKDELEYLNPMLKREGLEAGMTLKIPDPNADSTAVSGRDVDKKIKLEKYITHRNAKNIAIMLPFNLDKFSQDSINKQEQLKKDKVLRISLDFYSGVLAAIDSVKSMGIPVKAEVFDTRQSKKAVADLLQANNFSKFQAVIGPLLSNNLEFVSQKLAKDEVPVFSPLTDGELNGKENLFQSRPSSIIMEKTLITYIDSLKEGKNIVILTDAKHSYLRSKLSYTFPNARVIYQENEEYLQRSDLTKRLSEDQENWIIIEADDFALISNATSYLNALSRTYDIRLFTSNKSDPYENEISSEYLSNLKFTYASIAKEYSVVEADSFVSKYVENYGISPSKYAVRGFDITYDILLRLAVEDNIYKSLEKKGVTEYVENKFSYHKKIIGGYYNDAVYLMQYDKNLELKVIN